MKAQLRWGLALSWPRVTTVFLLDVLVLVLAAHAPDSWQARHHIAWWVGVALAVILTLISLVSYRGVTLVSGIAAWLRDWSSDPGAALVAGCTEAVGYQRKYGRSKVGVREYRGQLVTVIAVDGGAEDSSTRPRLRASAGSPVVPIRAVADAVQQFDIALDAIDIVTVRTRGTNAAAELSALESWGPEEWDKLAGQPPVERARTWLVLRMNPQRNVNAVVMRDSLAATLVAATERLAQDLDGQTCSARPLAAEELAEVDSAVLVDFEPNRRGSGWRFLKHLNGFTSSFWLSPADIGNDAVESLWPADLDTVVASVLTLHLVQGHGSSAPEISAWVRYHSTERLPKNFVHGLNPLVGRQLAAVRASLPAPFVRPQLVLPTRAVREDGELVLSVAPIRENSTDEAANVVATL